MQATEEEVHTALGLRSAKYEKTSYFNIFDLLPKVRSI